MLINHALPAKASQRMPGAHDGSHIPPVDRRLQTRRRWVLRTGAMSVLGAVVLCVFVIWRRDASTIASLQAMLDTSVAQLQAQIDETGWLPADFPIRSEYRNAYSYLSDAERSYAVQASGPVIVAYSRRISPILRADGVLVVIYEQGKVHSEWLTLSKFRAAMMKQERDIAAFLKERRSRQPQLP